MNKYIFIVLAISLIQGCTTFRIGELESTILIRDKTINNDDEIFNNLPVVIKFLSNQGMDIKSDYSATRKKVIETARIYFPNNNVDFFENLNNIPNEYINIHVIRDIPDERENEDGVGLSVLKLTAAILSGATAMILPMIDVDIEHHIKISYIKNGKRLHSTLYNQTSRRLIGFSMIPAAVFFNTDTALSASLSEAFEEYLQHEG